VLDIFNDLVPLGAKKCHLGHKGGILPAVLLIVVVDL
jgi:hypothetical protein